MPSLEWNRMVWDGKYDWTQGGDEWSAVWGGAEAEWFGSLLPRIYRWVPATTILEIAPGFGRWTQFLRRLAERLVIVDLSETCIAACQERFADAANIAYHVNDGRSLDAVPDKSVDFAFSFDSLVHAEADVLESYIVELSRTLAPDGTAFLHHSNLAAYANTANPEPDGGSGSPPNPHMRAQTVSAELVAAACSPVGLRCITQEIVGWGADATILSDCFSVLTPAGSSWDREPRIRVNSDFMAEASRSSARERLYSRANSGEPDRSDAPVSSS
jgi:SAM-dependent methyltransferase